MNKPKLIIHETDCHGCGTVYYNGECRDYSYDDGELGDIKCSLMALQKMGVPLGCEVEIYEGHDIYPAIDKLMRKVDNND